VAGTVTFDGAPPPGTINLGIGQPSADLLPVELIAKSSASFFRSAEPFELNYGVLQGDERFLNSLADFLARGYGHPANAEELFVTGGNSQAMDLVSTVFARSGDTVFVEEPSYFLAFKIFQDHGLNVVGIPIDDDGISIEGLTKALEKHKPAFLYTIPSYHNPGGQCLTLQRRKDLVALSRQHKFLIVADEVYQLLYYYDAPPPAFGTMVESDTVVSLGSFAKILAPGMRLGWIQTSKRLREQILANGFVNSGGSINHISSHIVRHAIDLGLQEAHIKKLRMSYRGRVEAMDETLHRYFHGLASWQTPLGGYFFWLKFADELDTAPLRERARDLQTGFQAGGVFSSKGALRNCLRLSFAHYGEEDIVEGIKRMRPLFD
jgi:DNA-binding transcriptional MocR family regulator